MIEDRIQNIEAQIRDSKTISGETRSELLELLAALKSEVAGLSETHADDARSIAGFADASAHEATRTEKKPQSVEAAIKGLTTSVEDFETSHPTLVQVVNRIAVILSNMGM